jgi:hypothetical protein
VSPEEAQRAGFVWHFCCRRNLRCGFGAGVISGEDERLYVAIAGPYFVLGPAGIHLNAFGPDLVALAGCGGSGGGMPGITVDRYRGLWVGLEIVVQAGCFAPPQLDAMRARPSGCGIPYTATVRGSPDLAPLVVRMTVGTPVTVPAKLRVPAVILVMSWSRRFAVGRRSATRTLVAAKVRIARWNVLASLKDRADMVFILSRVYPGHP